MTMTHERSNDAPLVSVVTPFHNTGEYLEECIQSVLAQTYRNFEYVLLDNCSTDASTQIAEKYAQQDPRIRLVKATELIPQIPNYNRALKHISPDSRYVKIVQADDWIFPTCLEEMVRIAVAHPSIGVVGSYSLYEDYLGHVGLPFARTAVFPGRDAIARFLLTDDGFLGSPTCVMYRSDLVRARDPFFLERYDSYEDVDASLALLEQSDFGFAFQVLTFNRRGNSGHWSKIDSFAPVLLHMYVLVKRYGPSNLSEEAFRRRFTALERRYYSMLASGFLTRKGKAFWEFHRERLAAEGLRIDRARLARAIVRVLFEYLMSPRQNLRKLLRRLSA